MSYKLRGLYAIADSGILPGDQLIAGVTQALLGGARMIQYRDKSHNYPQREIYARQLLNLCREFSVPFLINDNVVLALQIGAAGVHLGQGDTTIVKARELLGPKAIIGISCHDDLSLAQSAQQNGASYVAFGRFFPSRTKANVPAAYPELLTRAKCYLAIPIVAIGGITPENAAQLIDAGADLIAVIHGLFAQSNIQATAIQFVQLFD